MNRVLRATGDEVRELLEKFEGSTVFPFNNAQFVMSDETFKETNDETYEYFFRKKYFMSSNYKPAPAKDLKTYNPISHRISINRVNATQLRVICIE